MHIMENPVEGVKRDFAGLELDTDKVLLHSANKQKIMLPYLGELPDDLKDGGDAFITVVITNSLYARVALCQRQCDFVVFRRTGIVRKWRVIMYSL